MSETDGRTRRALFKFGLSAASLAGLGAWIRCGADDELDLPWPLRRILEGNGALWQAAADPAKQSASSVQPPAPGTRARLNGDIGLTATDEGARAIEIESGAQSLSLTPARWATLPRASESALFCCVEGWSEPMAYSGVRFSEVMDRLRLGRKEDGSFFRYVGLETPDGEYYVSLDVESMRHSQTLLADEQNGAPLLISHGAPVRLIIPIKYGIKSLKRVGRVTFADRRPPDYWNEAGYDWHASL